MKRTGLFFTGALFIIGCSTDPPNVNFFQEQLLKDVETIEAYLEDNEIQAEFDESGIYYIMQVQGNGFNPDLESEVTVRYTGSLLDGTVFDPGPDEGEDITFPLQNVITAWQIAVPWMEPGGKMTIYAPSGYCYGRNRVGNIPPNSILVFEIELISFE